MRRAFPLALCLLLAGCHAASRQAGRTPAAAPTPPLQPSPMLLVGRVLAFDPAAQTVIVEVFPFANLPSGPPGRVLITRTPDLQPTARLEITAYQRGQVLGTHLLDGQPRVGDEVVLPPAAKP